VLRGDAEQLRLGQEVLRQTLAESHRVHEELRQATESAREAAELLRRGAEEARRATEEVRRIAEGRRGKANSLQRPQFLSAYVAWEKRARQAREGRTGADRHADPQAEA
jgi:rubrerythrin